jgi:ATP-dependent Clp protease protease subunit
MSNSPYFIISVNDREETMDARTYFLNRRRTIYLTGDINEEKAFNVITSIQFLAEKSNEDIILYIDSPGGQITAGMEIYDVMQSCGCDIVTVALAAASMSSILLAAGTKGKRYALPSSEIMIHQPLAGMFGFAQTSDFKIHTDRLLKTKSKINSILAQITGKPVKTIKKDTERDNFFSAAEAVAYGLIDNIGLPA